MSSYPSRVADQIRAALSWTIALRATRFATLCWRRSPVCASCSGRSSWVGCSSRQYSTIAGWVIALRAILAKDYFPKWGIVLTIIVSMGFVTLLLDLKHPLLDPRVKRWGSILAKWLHAGRGLAQQGDGANG